MINFEANASHYKVCSVLGECFENFGSVQLAKHLPSGQMVAIKKFNMDRVKEDGGLIQQEIILTRQLKHPHILKYHVAFVSGIEVCVVNPLMGFGSCRDLLNVHFNEGLPENAVALILKDVLEGLEYVHKKGLIHRAIRASHILISATGSACLTGLRYACPIVEHGKWQKQIHSFPTSTARNLNWLSPEVLEQNLRGYNEKSDVYSIGMVICELVNGAEPFSGVCTTLMLIEKVRGSAPQLLDCTTYSLEDSEIHGDSDLKAVMQRQAQRRFNEGLHEVAALCLQKNPCDRPTVHQLLLHPYMKYNRRNLYLPDLLKPAIPLSNKVAYYSDEMENMEIIDNFSELDLQVYDWDF